jgi:hypothetical protein
MCRPFSGFCFAPDEFEAAALRVEVAHSSHLLDRSAGERPRPTCTTENEVTFWYTLRLVSVGAQVDDYGRVLKTDLNSK